METISSDVAPREIVPYVDTTRPSSLPPGVWGQFSHPSFFVVVVFFRADSSCIGPERHDVKDVNIVVLHHERIVIFPRATGLLSRGVWGTRGVGSEGVRAILPLLARPSRVVTSQFLCNRRSIRRFDDVDYFFRGLLGTSAIVIIPSNKDLYQVFSDLVGEGKVFITF